MERFLTEKSVATIVHLIAVVALVAKWLFDTVSEDDLKVFGIILASNAGVAVGRGLSKR